MIYIANNEILEIKIKQHLKKNPLETIRDKLGMSLSKQLQLSKAAAGFVLNVKV